MARRSPRARKKKSASRVPPKRRARRSAPGRGRKASAKRTARKVARHPRASGRATPSRKRAPAHERTAAQRERAASKPRASRRFKPPEPERVAHVLEILARLYPDATTALDHQSPLQLLIATILSAQCTDKRVNMVTPGLFARYPDARAFAEAETGELEAMIRSTGFFRSKARSIRECCADLVAKHGGQVPADLESLTALRGVGRKTANVVLGNAFGIPGMVVDTHVGRLSRRLGLTRETDAVKVEFALMDIVPREWWTLFSHWLILHGRNCCIARKPRCSICALFPHCPRVGVTTSE